MEEKLKTLKELVEERETVDEVTHADLQNIRFDAQKDLENDLRQESIKWIKELSNPERHYVTEFLVDEPNKETPKEYHNAGSMEACCFDCAKVNWIKQFFNISDKEIV